MPYAKKGKVKVQTEVLAYNSKFFYVITPGKDGQQVERFPLVGGDGQLESSSEKDQGKLQEKLDRILNRLERLDRRLRKLERKLPDPA